MKESQHIEWKETWRDEWLRWVCAFANAEGGRLHIGRNDRGVIVGVLNFESPFSREYLAVLSTTASEETSVKTSVKATYSSFHLRATSARNSTGSGSH